MIDNYLLSIIFNSSILAGLMNGGFELRAVLNSRHAELTRRDIGIVATQENIDTSESTAAKFFRRFMLAQGALS